MFYLPMSEVLKHLSQVRLYPRSHWDAVRLFDALMKPFGITVRVAEYLNADRRGRRLVQVENPYRFRRKARLVKATRRDLIVERVVCYTT
jgi:hypothetical protein